MPPRRRRRRSQPSGFPSGLWWVLAGLVLVVFAAGYLAGSRGPARQEAGDPPSPAPRESLLPFESPSPPPAVEVAGAAPSAPSTEPSEALPPPAARGARVALVIDDLGRSLGDLDRLEQLGVPISYSVLPFENLTPQVVAELQRRRQEILCHLPMEPRNEANPGPGALRTSMSPKQLSRLTQAALAAVPGARGVNNHMGSSLTADRRRMTAILRELKQRQLFFLDSRTSAESVGYRLALELGVPAAERQVFLDGDPAPEAIRGQFDRLLAVARERGAAIAIGHPYPSTLEVLAEAVPKSLSQGYEFVPVSFLLESAGGPD